MPVLSGNNLLIQSQRSVGTWQGGGSQLAWEVGKEHPYCYHIPLSEDRTAMRALGGQVASALTSRPEHGRASCPPAKAETVAGEVGAGAEV